MILKYTFRLIKSTFNRFIAILAIVFIGVSFMMGLRSNYDIMQESVELYTDDSKLYDFQIYSNFGFDQNDVNALKKQEYIEDVYASKTRDVYAQVGTEFGAVTRVLELDSNLNTIELAEGRMPEKENEVLIISPSNKLNEIVKITLDDEDETYLGSLEISELSEYGVSEDAISFIEDKLNTAQEFIDKVWAYVHDVCTSYPDEDYVYDLFSANEYEFTIDDDGKVKFFGF